MTDDRPEPVAWWRPEALLPAAVRPGTEPWRWAAICVTSFRVVIGISLAVAATGLIGMGLSLTLHGLGVIHVNIARPDPEALAVGVAITMIGCAILGLAVEGGFRSRSLRSDAAAWETAVTWIPALLIALWIVERLESLATRHLPPFSDLFNLIPVYLNEVGNQGLASGFVGLSLAWVALQFGAQQYRFIGENAPALLYVCWMAMVIISNWTAAS